MRANINMKTEGAFKRGAKIEDAAIERGNLTVMELGKLGQNFAKSIVYYETGFTYKSIKRRTVRRARGDTARIFIEPYIRPVDGLHRRSAGNYSNFSLVRWSHTSPLAPHHFRLSRGDPKFMDTTKEYLQSIKGSKAKGYFKSIKI